MSPFYIMDPPLTTLLLPTPIIFSPLDKSPLCSVLFCSSVLTLSRCVYWFVLTRDLINPLSSNFIVRSSVVIPPAANLSSTSPQIHLFSRRRRTACCKKIGVVMLRHLFLLETESACITFAQSTSYFRVVITAQVTSYPNYTQPDPQGSWWRSRNDELLNADCLLSFNFGCSS